jgi:catechol 2,3-dioxygenase-like lactoylglutathione lyase family enzyme
LPISNFRFPISFFNRESEIINWKYLLRSGMLTMGSTPSSGFIGWALLCALLFGLGFAQNKQTPPASTAGKSGKILGIAFQSLQVSDLNKSIEYYEALGFKRVSEANPAWKEDEAANRLYQTPGATSRSATLTMDSTASGKPFALYLYEYKGIERSGRKDYPARNPSSTHIGVMAPEADALWAKLQSAGMLRPLSWEGKLIRMPGQTSGGLAYVRDPDGFNIEIIGLSPQPANHPTLHHIGLTVLNAGKSKAFYGNLLGAKFPNTPAQWLSGDMYDSVVGGHGYVINLINGTFPEAAAPQIPMRFELVEYQKPDRKEIDAYRYSDIAVSCVGLQVDGLDALYARMKEAGIKPWSKGDIVKRKDASRAVVVRDPDVGAFVELFEKP